MSYAATALSPQQRDAAGKQLSGLLADLVAVSLQGKQAHWHVTGRNFLSLHQQLDTIVDDARNWTDLVAERAVTVGTPVDGNAEAVVESGTLPAFPKGFQPEDKIVSLMVERLMQVAERCRTTVDALDDSDLASQDVVIEVLRGLEKHLWMLQAQTR